MTYLTFLSNRFLKIDYYIGVAHKFIHITLDKLVEFHRGRVHSVLPPLLAQLVAHGWVAGIC